MATGFFRYNPIFLSAAKKESKVPSPYNLSFPDLPKIRFFRAYSFLWNTRRSYPPKRGLASRLLLLFKTKIPPDVFNNIYKTSRYSLLRCSAAKSALFISENVLIDSCITQTMHIRVVA
jgi:hypothetical protein